MLLSGLKNKTSVFVKGDVISYRLITGEEVIARVATVDQAGGVATVNHPIVVHTQMRGNQAAMAFAPFMVTVDEDSEFEFLYASMLVAPLKSSPEIKARYLEATTGIVPATAGIIKP